MPKVVPEYKEQAKKRFIEQALKTFSEKGYHLTRIADIAADIGVSKGAIYQYFDSKEQLFIEAIKYHGERRSRVLSSYLDSGSFRSISTGEFFDDMLELRMSSLQLSVDIVREIERNDALRDMLAGVTGGWGKGLMEMINEMKSRGEIRDDVDASSLLGGILALRDGLYNHIMMGMGRDEARKAWVYVMGLLMDAVLK